MNEEFVQRLRKIFGEGSMADAARRLDLPHATVRNYYTLGRLPAPEVLIKIARETGVSLNWLLLGRGEMYADDIPAIDLGRLLEARIGEMIERRLAAEPRAHTPRSDDFDVESAVLETDDPEEVMAQWFRFEGRSYPSDYGVVFFRGWEAFSLDDKVAALRDAKRMLDRSMKAG